MEIPVVNLLNMELRLYHRNLDLVDEEEEEEEEEQEEEEEKEKRIKEEKGFREFCP